MSQLLLYTKMSPLTLTLRDLKTTCLSIYELCGARSMISTYNKTDDWPVYYVAKLPVFIHTNLQALLR